MAGPARAHLPIDRGWPRLAEAGRGWPRLAEAGGCPELDLALTGCVKGRKGWRPRCGGLPRGGAPVGRVAAGLDRVAVVEGVVLEWHLVEVRLHMCT